MSQLSAADMKAANEAKEAEAEARKIQEEHDRKRREEKEAYARATQAKLEGRLPGGKRTKRLPVLKLEMADGDVSSKMQQISKTIYMLDQEATVASRNFQHWRISDERLFGDAKAAYDGIIEPFLKQPRVYKLESIKERVWEMSKDTTAEDEAKAEAEYEKKQKLMKVLAPYVTRVPPFSSIPNDTHTKNQRTYSPPVALFFLCRSGAPRWTPKRRPTRQPPWAPTPQPK